MFGFYVILIMAILYIAFMGGVIGYLIGKYWEKKYRMNIKGIKFKAKRLDNNTWVEGYFYAECGNTYIIEDRQSESMLNRNEAHQVDPSTVCQFTGLKDKKGTPIYEGDIVTYKDNNAERRGDINWDSKAAAFCFGQDFLVHYLSEDMVVIGNKFDKEK